MASGPRPSSGEMTFEHEVAPAIAGLLHREHVQRPLDHAQQRVVAARVAALRAQLVLAQGAATLAVPYPLHRRRQRLRQAHAAAAVALQQLQGHALRGLLPDTGEKTQRIDQLADQGAEAHG